MKIVLRPCRAGKTTEAIKESARTGAYIVVIDRVEAARVQQMALHMGLQIPFPLCFNEVQRGLFGVGCKSFVVDNADMILSLFLRRPIEMITLTTQKPRKEEFNA